MHHAHEQQAINYISIYFSLSACVISLARINTLFTSLNNKKSKTFLSPIHGRSE